MSRIIATTTTSINNDNTILEITSMALSLFLLLITAFFTQKTMALAQQPSLLSSTSSISLGADSTTSDNASVKKFEIPPRTNQIHLCILIHGWLGSPNEMLSIQQSLETRIEKAKGLNNNDDVNSISDSDEEDYSPVRETKLVDGTFVLLHSAACNSGKTSDGVEAGGIRVAKEVNNLIKDICENEEEGEGSEAKDYDISISFIGNSLGGLYARAAVADVDWVLPNGKALTPNVFCTTATPHLGKRGQTYIRLPRFAETGIGLALQPTGQDLFGLNKVIENLATNTKYLEPLKQFRKRIAYANAFGTDLQVPTATAAFLADTESPHYTQESNPPFMLTVTTPRDEAVLESVAKATSALTSPSSDEDPNSPGTSTTSRTQTANIPASTMARTLDALGWTKVFCDVRDQLFSVPVPFRQESSSEFKVKESWSSHELKTQVASRVVLDKRWSIPFGHTMLIANAKSDLYAKLNSGGMPFVEQLATEFLDDVLNCSMTS